ncbi:hypothetical protein QKT49_gp112 [Acanthamoeba castellanii medusavirus]|uniref:Uncharacterized protein n=1 Tax=Acanthamoeba castellanii medusavirus J1 TaxID=3114988 RepID=A0A3T1CWP0_9VIRU|nr:hypothetical protein QKT49_gp112 [Acanthamoeba castellanii medusavirus]BBI30252.1 hypothetical protein [Acanthamoeba castellanii medusavirus J1]
MYTERQIYGIFLCAVGVGILIGNVAILVATIVMRHFSL